MPVKYDRFIGYRVYLAKAGDELIVLLGGGTKASQSKDIARAKTLLADYKNPKRAQTQAQHSKSMR